MYITKGKHILAKVKEASNPSAKLQWDSYNMKEETEGDELSQQIQKVFQVMVMNFETEDCLTLEEEKMGISSDDNCYQKLSEDISTKFANYVVTVGESAYHGVHHDQQTPTKSLKMLLGKLYFNIFELTP